MPVFIPIIFSDLKGIIGWLVKNPSAALAGLLGLALAWGWEGHRELDSWKSSFRKMQTAEKTAMSAYSAEVNARVMSDAKTREYADARLASEQATAAANLAAYERLHPTNGWVAQGTPAAAAPSAPGVAGTPNPGSQLYAVSGDDLDICTENTVRLQNARDDWASELGK